jgi:hypothetical protein
MVFFEIENDFWDQFAKYSNLVFNIKYSCGGFFSEFFFEFFSKMGDPILKIPKIVGWFDTLHDGI